MAMAICSCGAGRLQWRNCGSYSSGKGCKYAGQSVRALPIRILTVGKKRSPGVQLLVDEYIAKLKNFCHVDDVQIRSNPKNARDARAQVDDEDVAIVNLIKSDDWVVMLDERGLDIGSQQMAELLGDAGNTVMDYAERTKVPSLAIFWAHIYDDSVLFPALPLSFPIFYAIPGCRIRLRWRLVIGGWIAQLCNQTWHWNAPCID